MASASDISTVHQLDINAAKKQHQMITRSRICLILAYLGPWPSYFNLFLHSCRLNADVDWFIVCDHELPDIGNIPNIRTCRTSKTQLAQRIADAVQTPINLSVPYKLCDFRPAYGVVFRDELRDYDFWGHCDNDVIFGRLRHFLTDDTLAAFDKVLIRGNLALYRNSDRANGFFRLSAPGIDFRDVFADPRTRVFDEWQGIAAILDFHNIPYFHDEFIANIDHQPYGLRALKVDNYYPQTFIWENGRIIRLYWNGKEVAETEFALIHLQKRQMKGPSFPITPTLNRFAVLPHGFQHLDARPTTPRELASLNRSRSWYRAYSLLKRPYRRLCRIYRERELLRQFPPSTATIPARTASR